MIYKCVLALLVALTFASACKDKAHNCHRFRRLCNSKIFEDFMKSCPATCNKCGLNTTTTPTTQTTGSITPRPPTPAGACGISNVQSSLIIAGTKASPGAWPWQVLMSFRKRPSCGGTLIAPDWVITAAHCVDGYENQASSFTIRAGAFNRNQRESTSQDMKVSKVIKHSGYNRGDLDNDIALFKLSKPFILTKYVQPACLPTSPAAPGTKCFITGWGKTSHPGSMTSILQQGEMTVVSQVVCNRKNLINIGIQVTDGMICAGDGGKTRRSGCHGDSGGPFVCKSGGKWAVYGAVSHGSGICSSRESFTVFANVYHFLNWIRQNTGL